jgi:hypothetical protein
MPYFIVKFGWFFVLISSNQIWIASNSNNRIKCVENYIHVIYSNCVLTSNLFSRSNRQHNYFVLLFEIFSNLFDDFYGLSIITKKILCPAFFECARQSFKKMKYWLHSICALQIHYFVICISIWYSSRSLCYFNLHILIWMIFMIFLFFLIYIISTIFFEKIKFELQDIQIIR